MMNVSENEKLPEFLIKCIDQIKMSYPRYSMEQVAHVVNVSPSTFGRIARGEIQAPAFETSISIAQATCSGPELQNFMIAFFPEIAESFNRIYTGNALAKKADVDLEEFFKNPQTYEIMMLATTRHGVSNSEVSDKYGNRGLKTLENLSNLSVVKFQKGRYFFDGQLNASQPTVRKLVINLLTNSYDLRNFGPARNMLTLQYDSVNKAKIYDRMRSIIDSARESVRELFNNPDNHGSDVVWVSLAMDTLSSQMNTKNTQGVLQ